MNTFTEFAKEYAAKYDNRTSADTPSDTSSQAQPDAGSKADSPVGSVARPDREAHETETENKADELAPTVWPPVEELRAALRCDNPSCTCQGANGNFHCPAHDDRTPSLSVSEVDGKPLWYCHAGCEQKSVTHALFAKIQEKMSGGANEPHNTQHHMSATPRATSASGNEDLPADSPAQNAHDSSSVERKPETTANESAKDESAKEAQVEEASDTTAPSSASDSSVGQLPLLRPSPSLRERGLTLETKNHFQIEEYFGGEFWYPTFHVEDGEVVTGRWRHRDNRVGQPKFHWLGQSEEKRPKIYNVPVLYDKERLQHGLFIVEGETDVWTMHQNGLAAISVFDQDWDMTNAVTYLKELGISQVEILFDNDIPGRKGALKMREMWAKYDVNASIGVLDGPLGFDVSDLFAQTKFDEKKFRNEIAMLPLASPLLLEVWAQNPAVGLPDAPNESEEDGDLLPCLGEEELEQLEMPQCLVRGLLLQGRPTLFTGKHNLGKSAIAVDLSLSLCTGLDWNGQRVRQGGVFYLAAEGATGIKKRLLAWKQFKGIAEVPNFRVFPMALVLENDQKRAQFIRTIQHHNPTPALVVIDTLSRCSGAADENSSTDMSRFVESADEICRLTGAAVLIVHHNSKAGESRGSSALPANCDGHLVLLGESGAAKVKLQVAKLKDFADGHKFPLRRQVVTLENVRDDQGAPETSVVFVPDDGAETEGEEISEEEARDGLTPKERAALNALRELIAANPTTANVPEDADTQDAPEGAKGVSAKEWRAAALKAGVASTIFDRAKEKLVEAGIVRCENSGTANARFFYMNDAKEVTENAARENAGEAEGTEAEEDAE